jgi:Helicase conserved C-terminal domain/PLD-like domain
VRSVQGQARGSDLFIVDNSDEEWTVLRYLDSWCRLSKSLDVATGYFEIGSLLALDNEWDKIDTIRVLMGDEVTRKTKAAFSEALKQCTKRLNDSVEAEKAENDFLDGVPAITDAIRNGKIQFRIYRKTKFHAKAYITHGREEVIGSFALVGSSNFTRPGLLSNVELNVQITGAPVGILQNWYEEHWDAAEDVTPEMLHVIERHVENFSPFDIYTRSLGELFRHNSPPADIWDEQSSEIHPMLDRYQRDGYRMMMERANKYGGAFLCDGVGLGKTFVGLMLLERLIVHEKKTVILLVPKSGRESVWIANLKRYLPQVLADEGFGLHILNHTDLSRPGLAARIGALSRRADAIIIDEAHNFRNPGLAGKGRKQKSRYRVLQELAADKRMFLLTATPVNNSLLDLMHLIELFSGDGSKLKQAPLGVHSLRGHFRQLEKRVKKAANEAEDSPGVDEDVSIGPAHDVYAADPIVDAMVVQRSRAFVKASQQTETKGAAIFPERDPPKVAAYALSNLQTRLLDEVVRSFDGKRALFRLAIYNPDDGFRRQPATDLDQDAVMEAGRRGQVVALIKVGFLKRLESSTIAFDHSCQNLFIKLLTFIERHTVSDQERRRLDRWKDQHADAITHVAKGQAVWQDDDEDAGEDLITPEMLEADDALDDGTYRVGEIIDETYLDLDQLSRLLEILKEFTPEQDGKLSALLHLVKTNPVLRDHKLLIFSEFQKTARYLCENLRAAGYTNVEQVDSTTKLGRGDVIKRFAPYYNGSSSGELAKAGEAETRILVSTDVLSEGLNLQDATRLINYDLHWNPVRLMQRIGRVDRRLNPQIEAAIIADHPDVAALRRTVAFWNFLPPDQLDFFLNLYKRVAGKTLRISKTFGIEGRQLLKADDDYDDLKNLVSLDGDKSFEEQLQIEFEQLKIDNPELEARIASLPNRIFSGKAAPNGKPKGVFFCLALPGLKADAEGATGPEGWDDASGKPAWLYYDFTTDSISEGLRDIAETIRSKPETLRHLATPRDRLRAARDGALRHVANGYLKQMQAPPGVEPAIKAWMEIN